LRLSDGWVFEELTIPLERETDMGTFLTALKDGPDPRASNTRHDLCELLVVGFVHGLAGQKSMFSMTS